MSASSFPSLERQRTLSLLSGFTFVPKDGVIAGKGVPKRMRNITVCAAKRQDNQ
jgi:hypothetical protein